MPNTAHNLLTVGAPVTVPAPAAGIPEPSSSYASCRLDGAFPGWPAGKDSQLRIAISGA